MIETAQEFVFLCCSKNDSDIARSLSEEASLDVWKDLIFNFKSHQIDVAQNRTIPSEVMRILAAQGDEVVRSILAEKRRLPPDLFDLLSKDPSSLVRKKVAANKKTSIDIVRGLVDDVDEEVARVAEFQLNSR
ncbi:hypothetical protein [Variovorax sp. CF313]|uniref:hypothetical protein n=1 Tax=Variovorax sp. CF313 TaxID=1144315 RepID=UPI0012F87208|nr:hypothetical protein [Variovorax sp. CF313]